MNAPPGPIPNGPGKLSEHLRFIYAELRRLQPVFAPGQTGERTTRGVVLDEPRPLLQKRKPRQEWFHVAEVLNDYLLCYPADARLLAEVGAPEDGFILVAKPKMLRTGLLVGATRTHGGYNYEEAPSPYDGQQFRQRITNDAANPDVEQIYPAYDVSANDWWTGDLILATEVFQTTTEWSYVSNNKLLALGLITTEEITPTALPSQVFPIGTEVHWLDLNIDARRWASTGLLTGDRVATDGTTTLPVVGWHP